MATKQPTNHCPCCSAPIALDKLMCRTHWGQVPPALQRKVYSTWRSVNGGQQGSSNARLMAVREYQRAREDAIRSVKALKAPADTTQAPGASDEQQAR